MAKRIRMNRFNGDHETKIEYWRDAIASLVMLGYEVYADEEYISFLIGADDEIREEAEPV